jgi:hypothetical protein
MFAAAPDATSEKFFMVFPAAPAPAALAQRARGLVARDRARPADQLAVGLRNLVVEEAGDFRLRLLYRFF